MALTLAQFRTKVLQLLDDPSLTRYTNVLVDEALLSALEQYSVFFPLVKSYAYSATYQYIETLPADFAASAIKAVELWPTIVAGVPTVVEQIPFYAYILDEQWVFETKNRLIALDDDLLIIYETVHTIDTLNSATASTVPAADTQLIAIGAAAHASMMRTNSQIEANNLNTDETQFLLSTSTAWLKEFNSRLAGEQAFVSSSWHDPAIDKAY